MLRAYGGQHVFQDAKLDVGEWLYTVTVRNDTTDTFTEIVIFYKRKNADGVVYLSQREVTPGEIRIFSLGVGNLMESYVIGLFIGEDIVGKLPPTGEAQCRGSERAQPFGHLRVRGLLEDRVTDPSASAAGQGEGERIENPRVSGGFL